MLSAPLELLSEPAGAVEEDVVPEEAPDPLPAVEPEVLAEPEELEELELLEELTGVPATVTSRVLLVSWLSPQLTTA